MLYVIYMKKTIRVYEQGKYVDKEINYIPFRYIAAVLLTIIEIVMIIALMVLFAIYIPYFYIAIYLTVAGVIIAIIGSNENPDYKIPWILFVIILPIVGFMLYFLFHERKLPKKIVKRYNIYNESLKTNDEEIHQELKKENSLISTQAKQLCNIANTHLYKNTNLEYFKIGEEMFEKMKEELKKAKKFIFMEFFIIEEGIFWNSILEILKEKAKENVEVKVVYDDIGCMGTLPGKYYKMLKKYNIDCVLFSKLKGQADGEFNNRSHRKILVIDGKVAFTGGVNIADEYINEVKRFGHWKDTGIKLEGSAVKELTKLFLTDFYINIKKEVKVDFDKYYIDYSKESNSYVIPFGDGPNPIYDKNVGKITIMNLLNHASNYVYIATPYLIIDNEMMKSIENAALRGVDVRIIVPHIPDKKMVFDMTKSNYQLLIKSNVKVYEYEPGFIHAKQYIADDEVAMIGTINLDYRSLTHHFENGVWIYKDEVIKSMKEDFIDTMNKSIYMNDLKIKNSLFTKFKRSLIRIFSPLL